MVMKKIIIGLIILLVIIIGGYSVYQFFTPDEYYCGLDKFGGLKGASSQEACDAEWQIVNQYKPFCEKLVQNQEVAWEQACSMVLRTPLAVCTTNLENSGIEITEEQKEDCYEQISAISEIPVAELEETKYIKEEKKYIKEEKKYTKPDDIYGEWPVYYGQYVEFEGYAVFVYKCEPCPEGAACEACFEPYYALANEPGTEGDRYYKPGQIIIQHILGEDVKQDHKYRVRGLLLPPERAFIVDIVGITYGDYPVVQPVEPAVEIQ